MQRVSPGYTIVEVMIFLAVSVALLVSAMNLISGKQSETEFNQKMRDTQSKIQDWLNDVSTGFTGGDPDQMSCTVSGNRPYVQKIAPPVGYSPSCVFLGKAIQFTDINNTHILNNQEESLYVYSVFGCQHINCSTNSSDPLSASMSDAKPDLADGTAGGGQSPADLTETFSLAPAHITSIKSNSPYSASHLIGFFNSFNTEQNTAQNGSEDLTIYEYNSDGNDKPANIAGNSSQIMKCIQLNNSCGNAGPSALTNYIVCLSDGRRTATLTITSSSGVGASTKLDYVACT